MTLQNWEIRRFLWYIAGFILFYAPVALFQRLIYFIFNEGKDLSIHGLCFRIQLEHLFDGKLWLMNTAFISFFILLILVAFIFGPIYCGKLCPTGAFPEYLSQLVPDKWKIDWSKYAPVVPIRYGMLLGYMLLPLVGGTLACAYCNFFVFDLLINYYIWGYIISWSSSLLLTLIFWLIIFGLFTKGGRGFCNFLCPIGAWQNLIHAGSSKLPFVYRLRVNRQKCIGCKKCERICPMRSIKVNPQTNKAHNNKLNCILCDSCMHVCPVRAISYGRGDLNAQ